jgi:hypothetical protein
VSTSEALHARVRQAISGMAVSSAAFAEIALDLARFQAASVPAFGRLCKARGVDLSRASVEDVPALPTDAFRYARIASHAEDDDVRVFRTSGTTRGELRGQHPFRTLETYEAAALAWATPCLFPGAKPERAIALVPDPAVALDSSLSFMVKLFVDRLRMQATFALSLERGVDAGAVERAAVEALAARSTTIVFSTAFGLALLLDALGGRRLPLPGESRVMVTGGFKGRTREIPTAELYARTAEAFAIPEDRIVGEYGMTELSSQLYEPRLIGDSNAGPGTYRPPPWLRVEAADPETLAPLPRGREGIARFVDLANVDSVGFVQTLDWVSVDERGDVRLFGRAPGAEPRGCSLALEELFGDRSARGPEA